MFIFYLMDQDLWLKALSYHGPLLLQTVLSETGVTGETEEENAKIRFFEFIKNKLGFLFKCRSQSRLPYKSHSEVFQIGADESSISVMPVEIFQNCTPEQRLNLFYKSLDRGDILSLRVINDKLPDNYKLLVLAKQEGCMKLDDLSLTMYLPKLQPEMDLAGGELKSEDLIRAAVCSCSIDERKLYVTLDSNVIEDDKEPVQLGKISEDELPPYIGEVKTAGTYVDYLHSVSEFHNPNWTASVIATLNLDRYRLYSMHLEWDEKSYRKEEYSFELKRKQDALTSIKQHAKAQEHYSRGNFKDAFFYLNKALSLNSQNVEALVSRGILYSNTNNLRKAFLDMEAALQLDHSHQTARKQMSVLLVAAAKKHQEQSDIKKAEEALKEAVKLDPENREARKDLKEIYRIYSPRPSSSSSGRSPMKKKRNKMKEHSRSHSKERRKYKWKKKMHHGKYRSRSRSKSRSPKPKTDKFPLDEMDP